MLLCYLAIQQNTSNLFKCNVNILLVSSNRNKFSFISPIILFGKTYLIVNSLYFFYAAADLFLNTRKHIYGKTMELGDEDDLSDTAAS